MKLFDNNSNEEFNNVRNQICELINFCVIKNFKDLERIIGEIEEKLKLKTIVERGFEKTKKIPSLQPEQFRIYVENMERVKASDAMTSLLQVSTFLYKGKGNITNAEKICIFSWLREIKYQMYQMQSQNWHNIFDNKPFLLNFEGYNLSGQCSCNHNLITPDGVGFIEHLKKIELDTINFVISCGDDKFNRIEDLKDSNKKLDYSSTITLNTNNKINLFSICKNEDEEQIENRDSYKEQYSACILLNKMIEHNQNKTDEILFRQRMDLMIKAIQKMYEYYNIDDFGYDAFLKCLKSLNDDEAINKSCDLEEIIRILTEFKNENYFFTGNEKTNFTDRIKNKTTIFYYNVDIEDPILKEIALYSVYITIWNNFIKDHKYIQKAKHIISFGVNDYKTRLLCEIYETLERRARMMGLSMVYAINWNDYCLQHTIIANNSYRFNM